MSTKRQRQILRNKRLAFEHDLVENRKESKKIVNKKKSTKKETPKKETSKKKETK